MVTEARRYSFEELLGPLNDVEKKNAPRELFVAGDVDLIRHGRRVSVVGSRAATKEGLARATKLSRLLVERGVVVVSGLAEGIDTAAHLAAIDAGGRTIAVLGTPLDQVFPAENRALQARIMREHLAVSQFEPGSAGGKKCFPMRNRTMALLSDATVVVEAGDGSGTLYQGWEALRLGRALFLLESVVKNSDLTWPAEMLAYGAEVLSEETVEFFFESLPEGSRGEQARLTL
ncbi:MAG TPA: DNA-processing protein DprA [Planctomycetota bacterium]|nr:DNA-processing protein DprA [Planctomycetota bacterium]